MLVLTRRLEEAIVLGEEGEITLKILSVRGNSVRVGIEAPADVQVFRQEVFDKVEKEKQDDWREAS